MLPLESGANTIAIATNHTAISTNPTNGSFLAPQPRSSHTDRPSAGYYLGAVSPEQASCHRRPHPPYHCGLPPDRIYSFFKGAWVRTADNKLMSHLSTSNKTWFGSEPPLCQSYKRGHPYPTFTTLHCSARFPRSQCQRICTSCKRLQMNWGANPNFGNGTDADPRELPG